MLGELRRATCNLCEKTEVNRQSTEAVKREDVFASHVSLSERNYDEDCCSSWETATIQLLLVKFRTWRQRFAISLY